MSGYEEDPDREPPPGDPYWHCREHPGLDADCEICEANEKAAMAAIPESDPAIAILRFGLTTILSIAKDYHREHDRDDLCGLCLIEGWAVSALDGKLVVPEGGKF